MFLFQQPEVHLHPRAQAELATFFASVVKAKRHTLFIETHSDYLIDRMRTEVRSGKRISPDDLTLLFFEKRGLDVLIHPMTFDEMGNVRGAPATYRKFFIQEEFKSLGVEGIE
jgi:predicted ATPase